MYKYLIIFLVLLLGFIFYIIFMQRINQGVSDAAPQVSKDSDESKYNIIAFGDSLTAGLGVELSNAYPAKLESALNDLGIDAKVINMGISGDTTYGGVERVDFVISSKPDIVLLGLGANDMLQGLPLQDTKKNLDTIIKKLRENDIQVVLLGMNASINNGLQYKKDFEKIYEDLADKYDLVLMPFMLEDIALKRELNQSDGIHPTSAGYDIMVKNMLPYVLESGVKR